MFSVHKLSCGYRPGHPIVKNASFQLEEGQMLCILGANGCGKSTLLKALCALLPHTGSIRLNDTDLSSLNQRELARNIALLGQQSSLSFDYTVEQTVRMGRYAHQGGGFFANSNPSEDNQLVEQALQHTGLSDLRHRPITQLSGGQLQRVFLARVFVQNPRIILLDEPTNHLDLQYQLELMEYLRSWLTQPGRYVVGVLHDINLALRYADSLLLMQDGNILCQSPPQQLDMKQLNNLYHLDVVEYMQELLRIWQKP